MKEGWLSIFKEREKNLALLIVGCTIVSLVHESVAGIVMTAVCGCLGASLVAKNWPARPEQEKKRFLE